MEISKVIRNLLPKKRVQLLQPKQTFSNLVQSAASTTLTLQWQIQAFS